MMKIPLGPIDINQRNWFYEHDKSIEFVHEVLNGGQVYQQTDIVRVPFRKLEPAFKRYLVRRRIKKARGKTAALSEEKK